MADGFEGLEDETYQFQAPWRSREPVRSAALSGRANGGYDVVARREAASASARPRRWDVPVMIQVCVVMTAKLGLRARSNANCGVESNRLHRVSAIRPVDGTVQLLVLC